MQARRKRRVFVWALSVSSTFFERSGPASRQENASKQKSRASVLIQSEPIRLYSVFERSGPGSRKENASKQKEQSPGSDSIRTDQALAGEFVASIIRIIVGVDLRAMACLHQRVRV
jgi:hypothetical protein